MHDILLQVEHLITKVSDAIWPVFLPFILVVGAIMAVRSIVIIQKKATEPAKLNIKNVIGPASISLGAMIGTGAIIGVLGALSKLSANGQANIEAMAIWALIKQFLRITGLIIICTQHFGSKRFPKTPWSADTCQIPWRVDCLINQTYHFCFIDINVISHIRKTAVSRIQITSHLCCHLLAYFYLISCNLLVILYVFLLYYI